MQMSRGIHRLTGVDEVGTHEALRTGLAMLTKAIEGHGGRVNHYAGDAILAEFGSVVDCVTTAANVQRDLAAENAREEPGRAICAKGTVIPSSLRAEHLEQRSNTF